MSLIWVALFVKPLHHLWTGTERWIALSIRDAKLPYLGTQTERSGAEREKFLLYLHQFWWNVLLLSKAPGEHLLLMAVKPNCYIHFSPIRSGPTNLHCRKSKLFVSLPWEPSENEGAFEETQGWTGNRKLVAPHNPNGWNVWDSGRVSTATFDHQGVHSKAQTSSPTYHPTCTPHHLVTRKNSRSRQRKVGSLKW